MFNNNLFLNAPQKADLSATVREASEAWQNGVFTWKDVETGEIWRTERIEK